MTVLDWLLDSDPSIRWQVMRDLTDAPADDVLRGLEYLRDAGATPDERVAEAIELVASKSDGDGRWLLEARYPGVMPVEIDDGEGLPSRWNTLRALRVLRWYEAG